MKYWIVFFFFVSLPLAGFSQADSTYQPPVLTNVEHFDPLKYPLKAVRKKIEGVVKIEIQVDEAGKYVSHNIISTPGEVLSATVEPFLPGLNFLPAMQGDHPAAGIAVLDIIFGIESRIPIRTEITFRFQKR
ncbi:MAG: energy transducer TonB [Bacteroidota bacterium]